MWKDILKANVVTQIRGKGIPTFDLDAFEVEGLESDCNEQLREYARKLEAFPTKGKRGKDFKDSNGTKVVDYLDREFITTKRYLVQDLPEEVACATIQTLEDADTSKRFHTNKVGEYEIVSLYHNSTDYKVLGVRVAKKGKLLFLLRYYTTDTSQDVDWRK